MVNLHSVLQQLISMSPKGTTWKTCFITSLVDALWSNVKVNNHGLPTYSAWITLRHYIQWLHQTSWGKSATTELTTDADSPRDVWLTLSRNIFIVIPWCHKYKIQSILLVILTSINVSNSSIRKLVIFECDVIMVGHCEVTVRARNTMSCS